MKKLKFIGYTFFLLLACNACNQEIPELKDPCDVDPTSCAPAPEMCAGATAGSANFAKFVAIGTSYTAGFQAGALFTEGQENSLGKILATQFACVGGGAFNQPTINSENGFNIFITPNPVGSTILGRFKLQGTPPAPAPVIAG